MRIEHALKYTTDTVNVLLKEFQKPEYAEVRRGQRPHELRRILSDAYRDAGHEKDADLLSDPNQHVVVRNGRVRAGRFTSHKRGGQSPYQTPEPIERGRVRTLDATAF